MRQGYFAGSLLPEQILPDTLDITHLSSIDNNILSMRHASNDVYHPLYVNKL